MAKQLAIEDVVIATITGGVFHDQDMRFVKDPREYAVHVQDLLQRMTSEKRLNHRFSLTMEQNKTVLIRQRDEERNIIRVAAGEVVYRVGNKKIGEVEEVNSEVTDIFALVDSILKQRNVGLGNTFGAQFVLAIPFSEKKALEVLRKHFFEDFLRKSMVLQQHFSSTEVIKFETRVTLASKNQENKTELQIIIGDEGKTIGLAADFQTDCTEDFSDYSQFAKASFNFFHKQFSDFYGPLLMEEGLDADFLTTGKR